MNVPNNVRPVGVAAGVLLVLIVATSRFVTVGPGRRRVLMTGGAVRPGVFDPGPHPKLPFAQSVAKTDVQVRNSQAEETAACLDLQDVTTTVGAGARGALRRHAYLSPTVLRIGCVS